MLTPGDHDGALQDLRQMVIHGVADNRPRPRVIGSERREAFSGGQRDTHAANSSAQHLLARQHQLMEV